MIEFEEIDYAAIITIELPGMDRPATVTLTLKPPDAVEVAPGEVKPLRDCTLSDLQAFADALEAELWDRYGTLTLSQLAATRQARLKVTILGEADEPLSTARERWLEQKTATGTDDGGETAAQAEAGPESVPGAVTDPPPEAEGAAEPAAKSPPGDEEERERGEVAEADDSEAPAASEPPPAEGDVAGEEPAVAHDKPAGGEKEAVDAEEESIAAVEKPDGAATTAPEMVAEEEQPAAPAPVETPVVEGAEPTVAPVSAPPSDGDMRVAGLRRPPGHPTPAAVDILINEPAFRDAQQHALSSLDREVAGMLVGPQPEKQPDGRYVVHVTDVIAAKHTRMSGASVTYTPESWRYVTDMLDERFPDGEAVIVGWYHTHPGFGIFLSGMDLFIHQNFFTQTWHVALVLDPRAGRSGFFCWNRQQTAVQPYEFPWPRWAAGSW